MPDKDKTVYIDSQGFTHSSPQDAISESQRTESSMSRGASGGCSQDAEKASGGSSDSGGSSESCSGSDSK